MPKKLEKYKEFDTTKAKKHIANCLSYKQHAYSSNTRQIMQNLESNLKGNPKIQDLKLWYENIQGMAAEDYYLSKDSSLQTLLQTPLESFQKDMQRQKDRDVIKEHFGIAFRPKIVLYTENAIAKKDLKVEPSKIDTSSFFQALFTILRKDIAMIQEAYEKGESDSDYLTTTQKEINDLFTSTINKRFNNLYCLEQPVYSFHIKLDSAFVELSIRKNGDTINLERQSTGFKKFFNLFFNFLHKGEIGKGDIVLIDEPENNLSIPAQRDLRAFLKDYGRKSGILFIIATHSPYMLDIAHLDEVRIVKALNSLESSKIENPKGSLIINDFSMLGYGKSDTLNAIRKALGDNIGFDETKLIFVEGIMDYNILNAYSQIYDYKDSNKLIFLPISGLGGKDNTESSDENSKDKKPSFSDEQRQKAQSLITFAKRLRIHPILLVDDDKAGRAMKEGAEKEFKSKLSVITLKDIFENASGNIKNNIYAIESLFSEKDRKTFGFDTCKENGQAGIVSSVFKNTNLKDRLSPETTQRFDEIFTYLIDFNDNNVASI